MKWQRLLLASLFVHRVRILPILMVRLGCQWETISDLMVAAFTWSSRLCSVSPENRHKHDKTIDNFLMSTPSLSRVGFTSTMYQSELQIQTIFQESENCAWRRPGILTRIRIFRGSTYYLFIRDAPDNLAFLISGIRPDTGNGCRISGQICNSRIIYKHSLQHSQIIRLHVT